MFFLLESGTAGLGHHRSRQSYPCIVKFRLDADIVAFLLVLRPKHLQLCGLQRTRLKPTNQFLEFGVDGGSSAEDNRPFRIRSICVAPTSQSNGQVTDGSIDNVHGRLDIIDRDKMRVIEVNETSQDGLEREQKIQGRGRQQKRPSQADVTCGEKNPKLVAVLPAGPRCGGCGSNNQNTPSHHHHHHFF